MAVYDVFLSYRRSDGSDLAKDLYQKLQRAGLRVFFDQSEMVDGHYFDTQISTALKQAPNYILVATPEVFPFRDEKQAPDWVKKEIELAFEQYDQDRQNRSLNILKLPDTKLPAKSCLPESLKNWDRPNRIQISWSLQPSELQRILKAVCHVNRRNIWYAAHRWLEESKQPGHRFASLHVNESIMPQAKHHKEDCQDQTTFPIHVSKEANDMQKQEIPLLDALRETSGHLYLIGQGGIGKTTALMHIMEAAYHEKQYTKTTQIPIFIELSRAPDTEGRLYDGITSTYIRRSVYQQIREDLYVKQVSHSAVREVEEVFDVEPSVAVKPVEELFLAKQDGQSPEYLLLLDGLNEVSHTEVNELPVISRIIREIQWLMDCPNVRVILTSRTDEEAVFHENISRLYLTGIQNEALRDYLQKSKHEEEIDAIFQNEPLLETLRIPLFLMMYAGLGQTKDVSSQGEILRIFFHEREQNLEDYTIQTRAKQVEQDVATASPKQSSVRITAQMQSFLLDFLLPEIAWAMERNDTFYLDTETIEEIIAPILTDKSDTAICGKYGKGLFTKYRTSSAKEHTAATAKKLLALGDDTLEVTESLIDIATRSLGILQERNGTYGFIHHHIRDYFAAARHVVHLRLAVYLQEKGSDQALTCLDDLKPEPIHLNIRRFIGEMLGEHHNAPQCINGTWTEMVPKEACDRTLLQRALFLYRNRFDEKNDYSVFTLVSILKEVRKDLSGIDFSGLNLTNCSLNGVRLGQIGIVANINDAKVNDSTFFHMGHTDRITSIAYSPDGHHLATGSADHTVKIWDINTGVCTETIDFPEIVTDFSYSPDGRYLVISSCDKDLELWDVATGMFIRKLCGHSERVNSVRYSPDGHTILSGSNDGTAKLWCTKTGKCLRTTFNIHSTLFHLSEQSDVISVKYSSDGQSAILGLKNGTVNLWDFSLAPSILYYSPKDITPLSDYFYPSYHEHFISVSCDDTIQNLVLNAKLCDKSSLLDNTTLVLNGDKVDSLNLELKSNTKPGLRLILPGLSRIQTLNHDHTNKILSCNCFQDDEHIITTSFDGNTKIWDLNSETCTESNLPNIHKLYIASYSYDGRYLATGSDDGDVKLWDVATGICMQTLHLSKTITALSYSPSAQHIVIGFSNGTIKIWDVGTGVCIQTFGGFREYSGYNISADFSPDGQYAMIGSSDGTVRKWNIELGTCQQIIADHKGWVKSVTYSPNGTDIVTVAEDNSCKIWDAQTGQYKHSVKGFHHRFITYSPDSNYIVTDTAKDITISNVSGTKPRTLTGARALCYSPNGLYMAVLSTSNTIKILDTTSNKLSKVLDFSHLTDCYFFDFMNYSPDGRSIALVAGNAHDVSINVINIKTKERKILGSGSKVSSIVYASDSTHIVAGYQNGKVKVWNVDTKTCSQSLNVDPLMDPIYHVCCSPDGHYIGAVLSDGSFELWNIDSENGELIDSFPNIPGLIVQGVDFRYILHPNSSLDEEHRELLRRYGAIID